MQRKEEEQARESKVKTTAMSRRTKADGESPSKCAKPDTAADSGQFRLDEMMHSVYANTELVQDARCW